jgi:hypothetical protein
MIGLIGLSPKFPQLEKMSTDGVFAQEAILAGGYTLGCNTSDVRTLQSVLDQPRSDH